VVSDYLLFKSFLFARQTLTRHEFTLFEGMSRILSRQVPTPDLVIYLHAPEDILLERFERRGQPYEANMDPTHIADLSRAYEDLFERYDDSPLVSVDTTDLDFATSDAAVEQLAAILHERPARRIRLGAKAPALLV